MRPPQIEQKNKQWRTQILILGVGLIISVCINLSLGSLWIPPQEILKSLFSTGEYSSLDLIVINYRLPKVITAILAGMALGVSGMQMQTFFRNPLAGPFVLGITSGASLGVALLIMAGISFGFTGGAWAIVGAAALGAALVMLLVVYTAARLQDTMALLIVGLMFGSATGAIVSVLQFFSQATSIQAYLSWTFGSLGNITWDEMYVFVPIILTGLLFSFLLLKSLNALILGENYAKSMGINLAFTKIGIIITTSLLAGTITAFCGPIAFIGVALPHLARLLYQTSDHRKLFPLIMLLGSIVMLLCDSIAQLPGSQQTLPINAITAIVGAPVIVWIILRKKKITVVK
jgi:iron complex transport system permease protein